MLPPRLVQDLKNPEKSALSRLSLFLDDLIRKRQLSVMREVHYFAKREKSPWVKEIEMALNSAHKYRYASDDRKIALQFENKLVILDTEMRKTRLDFSGIRNAIEELSQLANQFPNGIKRTNANIRLEGIKVWAKRSRIIQ